MARATCRFVAKTRRTSRHRALATLVTAALFAASGATLTASEPRTLGQTGEVADTSPPASALAPETTSKRSTPPAEFAGREGVLALVDGRVVSGKVTAAAGGYLLKRPGSTDEMVPAFLVRTAAETLTGCYENLRDSLGPARPESHLELADWCIRQKLYEEARMEVVAALQLDPNRRDARELLTRIEDAINPQARHRQSEAVPSRSADGFLETTGRTTEGISAESTSLFVRRIQPLLVSKCGNAACHGGQSGGDFHLVNIRRSSSSGRTANLENLRTVLSWIDSGDPGQTRLLRSLDSSGHANVFAGIAAETQDASLRKWVQDVALEKGFQASPVELASSSVWTPEKIELAAATSAARRSPSNGVRPRDPGTVRRSDERKPGLQRVMAPPQLKKVGADELVERVLKEERPDPFDPGEFNRQVPGQIFGNPK